jgi:type I restriction-modification system DNA methylase subunit
MTSKDEAKQKLAELIEKHQRFKNEGRLKGLNEETTKQWIDDLFRILGWDFIEDVVKEYGTGKRKRVDYAFKIAGTTKFLLEAKAYGEDLEDKYIKQILEYGYQNNKTWVVLTNFREIRVYNAKYYDKEEQIRRLFTPISIEDLVVRLDDLWVLSREGMKENLINQLATKYGKVKPKEAIDSLIFEDLLRWRKTLEKAILAHERLNRLPTDPVAAEAYIDEAVQKILDRIVFVRVCEDRGLEEEELLRWCIRDWKANKKAPLMSYLSRLFSKKNGEYNSGIFATHYSENLTIENDALEMIIEESYVNPNGLTYDFSAIDADILGTIYENYLAYIQKRVWDKEAKQKSKRKAQGIYYTPTYIVDYIVKNTLGEKLKECSKPEEALKIKVLDPACGSGSFLIRAYDEFKNWYSGHMKKNGEKQHTLNQELKGTTEFMDKVLENCIYGVDLDPKAVEIAQLNILLKAAEGKHKLPTLNHTIQCGNSLIDDQSVAGERAFKWEEKFPDVFRNGGFDVVVGNPPYINAIQLNKIVGEGVKEFWKNKYDAAKGTYDIYILFFEQALKLCKVEGVVSFITPNKYLSAPYGIAFRELVSNKYTLSRILDLSKVRVFADPSVYPMIVVFKNQHTKKEYTIIAERIFSENLSDRKTYLVSSKWLSCLPENIWGVVLSDNAELINKIIQKSKPLEEVASVQATSTAAEADEFSKFIYEQKPGIPIINTGTIDRYSTTYGQIKFMNKGAKLIHPVLDISKINENRRTLYQTPKIILSKLALRIEGFLDLTGAYASINTNCIYSKDSGNDLRYLAGLINSKLISFVYSELFSGLRMSGGYYQFQAPQIRVLPIADASSVQKEKLGALVTRIVLLYKRFNNLSDKDSNEAQTIRAQIEKTDTEIDRLVYELYGLSEDEIKIVEDAV